MWGRFVNGVMGKGCSHVISLGGEMQYLDPGTWFFGGA